MKIKIFIVPTLRDSKGLAYSSRNKLLNKKQKQIASYLFKTIKEIFIQAKKNPNKIIDLEIKGRKKSRDITLYESLGIAIQDIAVAKYVYDQLN